MRQKGQNFNLEINYVRVGIATIVFPTADFCPWQTRRLYFVFVLSGKVYLSSIYSFEMTWGIKYVDITVAFELH